MYVTNDVFRTGPLCVSPVDEKDLICIIIIIIMLRLILILLDISKNSLISINGYIENS